MPEQRAIAIAGAPKTSESEEMYLLTVAVAAEGGHRGPLGIAALAEALGVSTASANEMVRKLESRGLLAYEPYRGVSLSAEGRAIALRVLRTRRLWSCFLVDRLGFTPREADLMACELEHVTPVVAAERLAEYLDHPATGPLGRPIPGPDPETALPRGEPLSRIPTGIEAEVSALDASGPAAGFLAGSGMAPGAVITVRAVGPGGLLVETEAGPAHLDAETAASILVQRRMQSGAG
jgi:DtxR family Mn-dependent transcriptional regulator